MTTRVTGERGDHVYTTRMEMGMVRVIEMLGNRKIRDILVGLSCEAEFHDDVRKLASEGGYKWVGEEIYPELRNKKLSEIIGSLHYQMRKRRREEQLATLHSAIIRTRAAYRHCHHWTEIALVRCGQKDYLFVPAKFAFSYLGFTFLYTPTVTYSERRQRYEVGSYLSMTEQGSGRRVGSSYSGEKKTHEEAMARLTKIEDKTVIEVITQAQMPYDFPEPEQHGNDT